MKTSGLVSMIRNRMQRETLYSSAEYWDSKAADYAGSSVSMWPNQTLNHCYHNQQVQALDQLLPDLAEKSVLELGCGTGRISRHLAGRGAKVTALDFSSRTIELARRENQLPNLYYRVGSVLDIQEPEQAYDHVVCGGCLTVACRSAEDVARVAAAVQKTLRRDGTFCLVEPLHRGLLHRVLNLDVREFASILKSNGFALESMRGIHFWPARVTLGYFNLPRWITLPGYHLGEACLRVLPNLWFSDYKLLCLRKI